MTMGKHDGLFRDPTILTQRELTFLNLREPMYRTAAEDGRKRSTALPPLEREPTFQRKPKFFNPYDTHNEEASDSHWKKKYEKVSIEVDNKIKNHLKKQLLHRFERRLKKMEDAMSDSSTDRQAREEGWEPKKKTSVSENRDLFSKYTETGVKTSELKQAKRRESSESSLPQINSRKSVDHSVTNGNTKVQFPDIHQNGDAHEHLDSESKASTGVKNGHDANGHVTAEDKEVAEFSVARSRLATDSTESFRNLDVSPVQTPQVVRPMTREQTRLSFEDRMRRILKGHVHVTCPTSNNVIRVYISSGFTDSEAERTILMERVYPELKALCALKGKDFRMVDPHWGLADYTTDDHSVPEMALENLEECSKDHLQAVNMVVILTDRYGEPVLPVKITVEEFEQVHSAMYEYTTSQRKTIQRKLAELEKPTADKQTARDRNSVSDDGDSQTMENGGDRDDAESGELDQTDSGTVPPSRRESQVDQRRGTVFQREADAKRDQQLIKVLKEKESSLPEPEVLETWYRLDKNSVPHVYRLQNISSIIKDFGKGDASKREHSRQIWRDVKTKLLRMLNEFGKMTGKRPPYSKSLFEIELDQGLLENDTCLDQCVVIHRFISDMNDNLDDMKADEFADVTNSTPRNVDREKKDYLDHLKDKAIPKRVQDQYILPFQATWAPAGVRIGGERTHQTYLDRMGKHVCDIMKKRLLESFNEEQDTEEQTVKIFDEVSQHVQFYQERSKHFQGMKDSLQVIKSYVRSRCPSTLVVHGNPGCGKSALLSKAAKETRKWLRGHDVAVVVRSVGASKESRNIRNLLYSICLQLCVIFDNDQAEVPTDYVGLINDLEQRLSRATESQPLVLYLDALDQLEDDNQGRKLAWLPRKLPPHVHMIVSTLSHEKFECMPSLKSILNNNEDLFLKIPELQETDGVIILHHWCNVHNHDITNEQFDILVNAFKKCPSPLFLKLLFGESLKWASYTEVNAKKLADSVSKMAAIKFGQMEVMFGESFIRRSLGYMAASRNGITDDEMLDLLSLDDAVMSEISMQYSLVRRRFPPSLWLRLRREMSLYIKECSADNVKTLQFAHLHFFEAARDRYLKQKDKAPSYHKAMGEYFSGMWVTKPKPYPGNDKGVLRYVASQLLYYEPKEAHQDGSDRVYNLRKINELPYHLLRGQQMQMYKSETVCNFEWVLAKLCGTSLRALVEEYHIGLETEPSDLDLKTLSDTLQLSATAVLRDPRQIAGQVVGRLQGIVNRDIPATPGDPPRYPYLHAFLAQAKNTSIPALVPSIGCLTEPGGILYDLLSGHTKPITAVTTTTDAQRALTASEDNTLKVWDLKNGKVTSTIYDFGTSVSRIRTAFDNKLAISVEGSVVKVWCLISKSCKLVIDQYLDPPVITIAGEGGKLLVALFDGVNILRTWDLDNEYRFVCESKIDDNSVFSDNSVVLAPSSYGDYVLHAFRGNNASTIQHAKTGKVIHTLKCHDNSSSVVALAITRDYMVVACRQQYMKLHEIHQLELFDAKKGKYLRSIRCCTQDIITEMHINLVGSHAIVVCASEITNSSNIMITNLETEDHKHLAKHSGVSNISACADFRFCLTAQKGDNTLKIWNISKHINQPMPKLKKALGVAEIHPMIDNPRYAIARQVNHGPISIWNVAKAKCLANAVRIERGLSESSDIVLIRNCNVVILTERGLKGSKPVFKTILIYDLRSKRYVKRLTGCFIVPSPAHEYVLLDAVTLLGPAETRNHFIIWSLETGKEMFRIRPQFKESERKRPVSEDDIEQSLKHRASTAKLTPWERRTESLSAKQKRRDRDREEERQVLEELQKEKQNAIEQFIISGDLNVIVASFYAHHLVVLNVGTKLHTQTLENEHSMLFLHVSALNYDGSSLVHANYDEFSKVSYVTIWDTESGQVRKRLKNETDVLAIAITDDASRVVFGKANKELRIWDPDKSGQAAMKKVKGYDSLEFGVNSKIFILNNGERAVVFAGDISLWDLESALLLATFTPDTRIECLTVAMTGQLITLGVHDYPELVVLKMVGKGVKQFVDPEHEEYFGETTGDTSDEDEDDDED